MRAALIVLPLLAACLSACGPGPSEEAPITTRALKLVVAMQTSRSFTADDPDGTRASALAKLLEDQSIETEVMVVLFSGSNLEYLTLTGEPMFVGAPEASKNVRDGGTWRDRILNDSVRERQSDFVTPLAAIRTAIAADIAKSTGIETHYQVLFAANDAPPSSQDHELLCGEAVSGISALSGERNKVRLNTVFFHRRATAVDETCPDEASETECAIVAPRCGLSSGLATQQYRLKRMATLGNGRFVAFDKTDEVDYSSLIQQP